MNATTTASQPAEARPAANPNTLEAAIREHIANRASELNGEPIVRFSPAAERILSLARPTYEFQIVDRGERLLGMVALEATILEHGRARQTVPLLAEVTLRKEVVVAVRAINRGETIRSGDLRLEVRTFDRAEDIGLSDLRPLAGQRVKRFIEARAMLQGRDIEPVPLVVRNDLITVVVRRGGLMIRGSAKAMNSAGFGEVVTLKNENSKETFTAIVTAEKTAEINESRTRQRIEATPPHQPETVAAPVAVASAGGAGK